MKSLHLTGLIHSTGKQADQDYCRLLVVYDRQTNGALPAASDILKDYDQSGSSSIGVFSGINPDNRERFVILADYRLAMPGTSDIAPGISANHAVDPVAQLSTSTGLSLSRTFKLNFKRNIILLWW